MNNIDPASPPRVISTGIGRFYKAAASEDFLHYVDYNEPDIGIMYDRKTGALISNNYFASVGLYDDIMDNTITWCTRRMKQAIKYLKEQDI